MNTAQLDHENKTPPDCPPSEWEPVDLADEQVGNTLIEYFCSYNGSDFHDFGFQTRKLNRLYPNSSRVKWIDPTPHDTALDAVMDADSYLASGEKKSMGSMHIIAGQLHVDAAIELFRKESK